MLLRRLKEQNKDVEGREHNSGKQRQCQEQVRRKKIRGKTVTGASDNLRAWWKEKVRFDHNGPAAISKYVAEHSVPGNNAELYTAASTTHNLQEWQDTTLSSLLSA
ncbi:hypothetical protein MLD38_008567 [Melastoma candidum]|uniref:Uncharacterized protein n=1 Tax=Melastoma candidum TaxID=119954 RepID=A0ACB9S390_9MYRT|nr:hypothetical protein MLD38_008567 [Melastoma candidum]